MDASSFCRSLQPCYAEVGGIRTHFVACGDGPPVVLIHGLGASFWNWWRNLPELARHFRVIAFDLLGCGASAKPAVRYTVEACTRQMVGLLDLLGIQRAALVGHSMGSRIALNTALAHPERVDSMVLAGPSCYPQTAGRPVALLLLPGVGEIYSHLLFTGRTERLVRRALRFSMHPRALITDEEIQWNMVSGAHEKRLLGRSYLRYGRHMRFHRHWPQTDRLHEIDAKVLLVVGDDDPFVPEVDARRLAQALPRATLEVWSETRHLPHVEHPARFNQTVSQFLRSHIAEAEQVCI